MRLRTHRVVLQEDEAQARASIERAFEQAGLPRPPGRMCWRNPASRPREPHAARNPAARETPGACRQRAGVPCSAIEKLRRELAARRPARFNVGTFKEWTGISRKYAIPLLEYLDRARVTRREGDERVVL